MSKRQAFNLTPAELLEKWIEALEGDRFHQTIGALKRFKRGADGEPPGHCCLGVLCEVYAEHGGRLQRQRLEDGVVALDGCDGMLPDKVQRAVGLRTEMGDYEHDHLAGKNDSGATFREIAKILRNPPPRLLEEQS